MLTLVGCGSQDASSGLLGTAVTSTPATSVKVVINELVPRNQAQVFNGDTPDWVELYNLDREEVVLAGYYVSDSGDDPTEARLPIGTTIAGHSVLQLWLGDLEGALDVGLSGEGDEFWLFTPTGEVVDSVTYGATGPDRSYARFPDGTGDFSWCDAPTPNELNGKTCAP